MTPKPTTLSRDDMFKLSARELLAEVQFRRQTDPLTDALAAKLSELLRERTELTAELETLANSTQTPIFHKRQAY